jgi:hypothetical protein
VEARINASLRGGLVIKAGCCVGRRGLAAANQDC